MPASRSAWASDEDGKALAVKRPGTFTVHEGAQFADVDERVGHVGHGIWVEVRRASFLCHTRAARGWPDAVRVIITTDDSRRVWSILTMEVSG